MTSYPPPAKEGRSCAPYSKWSRRSTETRRVANRLHRASFIRAVLDKRVRREISKIDPGFEDYFFLEFPTFHKIKNAIGAAL